MAPDAGLVYGRFLPLHQGHELLLEAALCHCAQLRVVVGVAEGDAWSFATRERWLSACIASRLQTPTQRYEIHADVARATDDAGRPWWAAWIERNGRHLRRGDRLFTSDRDGAEIARRTGLEWFPVDPDRLSFPPVTAGPAAPQPAYRFVSDVAKPDVGITVAVLGAEATGKSTLVRFLAAHYGTRWAPEWGRTLSETKQALDEADFDAIVRMQAALIRNAQLTGSGICFTDTEALTTALFAPHYLGRRHALAETESRAQRFDLCIVLAPSVPQVHDGVRFLDEAGRAAFHADLVAALEKLGRRFVVIDAPDFVQRQEQALAVVEALLAERSGP